MTLWQAFGRILTLIPASRESAPRLLDIDISFSRCSYSRFSLKVTIGKLSFLDLESFVFVWSLPLILPWILSWIIGLLDPSHHMPSSLCYLIIWSVYHLTPTVVKLRCLIWRPIPKVKNNLVPKAQHISEIWCKQNSGVGKASGHSATNSYQKLSHWCQNKNTSSDRCCP